MPTKKDTDDDDLGPVLGTGAAGDPDNPGRELPGHDKPKAPQPAVTPVSEPEPAPATDTTEV